MKNIAYPSLSVVVAITIAMLASVSMALADDDDLTRHERSELREALRDIGCHGGELEKKRNGTYEAEDVRCRDGKEYEFRFTRNFELIDGKRD